MIFKPARFRADWYGWVTNQISHSFIGLFLASVAGFGLYAYLGEYPQRIPLATVLVLCYFAYEILQGQVKRIWADSIEDTVFFGYGVFLVLGTLHEVERTMLTLRPDVYAIFTILGLIAFHCILGVGIRVVQRCRQ